MIRQFVYTVYKYLNVYTYDAYYTYMLEYYTYTHTYIRMYIHRSIPTQVHKDKHTHVYVNIEVFDSNRQTNELTMHEQVVQCYLHLHISIV